MSLTPRLGSFNKDKVANKFGIQLKTKDGSKQSSTQLSEKSPTTTETCGVLKTKITNDFHTDNDSNGFFSNTDHVASSNTSQPAQQITEKSTTRKKTSELMNTSVHNEKSHSLNTNVNHSTNKLSQATTSKSPNLSKKSIVTPIEQVASLTSPVKQPIPPITNPRTEAQIEHQKDQPLYRRQLSKPLENTFSTVNKNAATNTAATNNASTTLIKR